MRNASRPRMLESATREDLWLLWWDQTDGRSERASWPYIEPLRPLLHVMQRSLRRNTRPSARTMTSSPRPRRLGTISANFSRSTAAAASWRAASMNGLSGWRVTAERSWLGDEH